MHDLARSFFHPAQPTADIGCGSGRDTAWLQAQGFPATGYDTSQGMLDEARKAYPAVNFAPAALPDLKELPNESFGNILCSTTLMHVAREDMITAVLALARVLRRGGRLLLSVIRSGDIHPGRMAMLLESAGLQVRFRETDPDQTRPGIAWTVIGAEKNPESASRGLERVQAVLVQDKKDATYKLALIRALCEISRTESHLVRWGDGEVLVPLWPVAVSWLRYYWPFVTADRFVAQKRGERPGCLKPIAFREEIASVADRYGAAGLAAVLDDLDDQPEQFVPVLKRIAQTVREGPIQYAGTAGPKLFQFQPAMRHRAAGPLEEQFGWIRVPEAIWSDISRFDHWIEDSLILRWADLTAEMNRGDTPSEFLPLLMMSREAQRDTSEVHRLLRERGDHPLCVWTGRPLDRKFDVDHLIPYSVWGNNDWWNLLPSHHDVNLNKSDSLPSRRLLAERRGAITACWRLYSEAIPARFSRQISRALGISTRSSDWERVAFAGLQEAVEQVAATRGLRRWEPPERMVNAAISSAAAGRHQSEGSVRS